MTAGGRDIDRDDSRERGRFPSSLVECVHDSACMCACMAVHISCFHISMHHFCVNMHQSIHTCIQHLYKVERGMKRLKRKNVMKYLKG